eukprot:TRINITY_DN12746_c0_g1_i1.p1 TRINITY_DN12746_c0_g1~~TRINITY_DN12746_c0_g1_i1.p1  ORF type:complete len:411 (+),score=77.74 TRINITY_DN12746_c0_g1_i1:261-1493(+)
MRTPTPSEFSFTQREKTMPGRKNKAIKLNNEGNVMYRNEMFDVAVECYTKAIELNPGNSSFYGNRGQAYFRRFMYEEAVNDALMAVKLDPGFWKGFIRAGKGMLKLGRLEEAEAYFMEVKKYTTEDEEAVTVAEYELEGLAILKEKVDWVHVKFASREYYSATEAILAIEESIPQSYELKMILCECNYQRKQYSSVLKTTSAMKKDFHLTSEQHQNVVTIEMKAFAALSSARLGGGVVEGDLYELLGVGKDATAEEISVSYTSLALKYHPERQTVYVSDREKEDLTKKFLTVTQAFIILSDDTLKALYDHGYPTDVILSDDIDLPATFCGILPPPSPTFPQYLTYKLKQATFWACSPLTATATCPVWFPFCVRNAVTTPGWVEEIKHKLLSHKRDNMLEAALAAEHRKKA